jgi:hypothetical protein
MDEKLGFIMKIKFLSIWSRFLAFILAFLGIATLGGCPMYANQSFIYKPQQIESAKISGQGWYND